MNRTLFALLVLGVGAPQVALANPAKARAETEYGQGVKAFKARKFQVALGHFERAFKLDPSPVLLYNLARCHEELGRYAQAQEHYELYLARTPDASDRARIEERIRLLRIERRRQAERAEAAAKAKAAAEAAAKAEAQAKAAQPAPPTAATGAVEPAGDAHLDWWGYGLVGLGVAGLAYGVGMGLSAQTAADDHAASNDPREKDTLADDATSAQTQANLGYVVGGLLVAGGISLVVWDALGDDAAVSVAPTPGGGAVVLGGRF